MSSASVKPKPIVIIVNHGLPEDTSECVDSVLSSDMGRVPVLLVDNGSKDDSIERLRRRYPEIPLLSLPENRGFVGGFNVGIQHALDTDATHLLLLNNDTVVDRSAIREMLEAGWDIAVPKIVFYDRPDIIWSAGASWRFLPPSVRIVGLGKKDAPAYNIPGRLEYATSCALLVRRGVFEQIGSFDPLFESYGEDLDFFYRARQAGIRVGYVPSALIRHKVSLTTRRLPGLRRRYLGRSTVLFFRKEERFPLWQLYLGIAWKLLRETALGNPNHLADYWRGYRDGFRELRRSGGRPAKGNGKT
jgi:GT2 family glycosyltransferase